jgi:hypothetical protein
VVSSSVLRRQMVWSTLNNFDTYEREQIVLNVVFTIKEGVIGGGGGGAPSTF